MVEGADVVVEPIEAAMAVKAEEAVEVKPGHLCRLRAACVVVEQHPDRTVGVAWQRQPRQRGMLWVEAQDVVEFLHERLLSVLRLARVAEQPQEELERQLHLGKVTKDRKKGRMEIAWTCGAVTARPGPASRSCGRG